jgi:hypothetical protein
VGHHLDGVELALHGPGNVHCGPGVAHHHGHLLRCKTTPSTMLLRSPVSSL